MNPFSKTNADARRRNFGLMPRLKHWPDRSQPFDWQRSEVGQWLRDNPKALDLVFEALKSSGAIIYDIKTGEWKGCYTP
jgi:hypothetical protein